MIEPQFSLYDIIDSMFEIKSGTQMFCPNFNGTISVIEKLCSRKSLFCSGILDTTRPTERESLQIQLTNAERAEKLNGTCQDSYASTVTTESPGIYKPEDKFHIALCIPTFDFDKETRKPVHRFVDDTLALFRCSRFSKNRKVPLHLMQLEQMLNAIHLGGFCVTVLPDNWQIADMRYNRWLETNASVVAKVDLPPLSINHRILVDVPYNIQDQYGSKIRSGYDKREFSVTDSAKWKVWVFFKPYTTMYNVDGFNCPDTKSMYSNIEWSEYTYTPFRHKLESFDSNGLEKLTESFKVSEWYKMSVFQWIQTMDRMKATITPYGTNRNWPIGLQSQEEMFLVKGTVSCEQKIHVVDNLTLLKKSKKYVQIKPTRSKIKIIGHNQATKCAVSELMGSMGYSSEGASNMALFLKQDFETIRHKVVSEVYRHGLVPCMLGDDEAMLRTRSKWLNRQLTPIERYVATARKTNSRSMFDYAASDDWDVMYDGIGIRTVCKQQYDQWMQRAKKIRLDRPGITFKFQLDDIIVRCMKDGNINGSVMGLGKTREMLMTAILRGARRVLIICPKKLIGTWQDEIEDLIIPLIRSVRRNWNGELFDIGMPNIIEYAEDCLKSNLTMFNIISYDKLKSTPKDGTFFKCPKCDFVTFSAYGESMRCPGDPFDYRSDPMEDTSCVGQLRRYKLFNSKRDEEGKLLHQKYRIWKQDGRKVHWDENHPSRDIVLPNKDKHHIPNSSCKIIDTRKTNPYKDPLTGGCPRLRIMKKQDRMYDKTRKVVVGEREEIVNSVKATVPVIRSVVRKCHNKKFHVKWTFAEILRWRFSFIGADEIMYIANGTSQRGQAMNHLTAVTRYTDTGTPMVGKPQKIRNYVNWTIDRDVYPWYRAHDPLGLKRFLDRYKTDVMVSGTEGPDGELVGGVKKQIHKIKNADLFMSEIAPAMIRRTRGEPEVVSDIPDITCTYQDIIIPMDVKHSAFYRQWIEAFSEWWEAMKEEEEGKKVAPNVLAKMSYLINASTSPHNMMQRLLEKAKKAPHRHANKGDEILAKWLKIIKPYKGPHTGKMLKAMEIVEDASIKGDKTLIGCTRTKTLRYGLRLTHKRNLSGILVDGGTSLDTAKRQSRSKRHLMVQEFRFQKYNVMWCGLVALSEGMNIPEANHVVAYDSTWEPKDTKQFFGRVIRPAQTKTVNGYYLMHEGTIEEYMIALNYLKARSHSEGIDGIQFDDISADMIPDIRQYADAIVDGTENVMKRKMWLKVEEIKKDFEEEGKKKLHDDDYDNNKDEEND